MKSMNQQEAGVNNNAKAEMSSDSGCSDAESMDEELTGEIINYLVGIKETGDTIIDISDTIIGDKGALMVADVIPECTNLAVIKLSSCGITNVGAKALF